MQTRLIRTLVLAVATAAALALGGAALAHADDNPTLNRGWSTPVGADHPTSGHPSSNRGW